MANIKEARLLLPWYITNSLDKDDKQCVEAALKESVSLREEMTEQANVFDLVKQDQSVLDISVVTTVNQRFDALLMRIDEEEKQLDKAQHNYLSTNVVFKYFKSKLDWFLSLFTLPVVQYSAAGIMTLLVVQAIVLGSFELSKPLEVANDFQLSDDEDIIFSGTPLIARSTTLKSAIMLVFNATAKPDEISRILKQYDMKVISHPDSSMNYLVELAKPLNNNQFDALLERIVATQSVSFASEGEGNSANY